jgi:hypothetical protein
MVCQFGKIYGKVYQFAEILGKVSQFSLPNTTIIGKKKRIRLLLYFPVMDIL